MDFVENNRGGVGIIIFLLFIVLIIAVIFLVIFLKGRDEVKPVDLNVSVVNKTYFNVTLSSNAMSRISYILSNSSQVLVKGNMFASTEERFYNVEANTSIILEGFSSEYYYNKTTCNVTRNMFNCKVGLKRKSLDYVLNFTNTSLMIDPVDGVLQSPILLCWSERENVANVVIDLPSVNVPVDKKKLVDFCYVIPKDIGVVVNYSIDIHFNPFYNSSEKKLLKVLVRDYEIYPYHNIGDKEAGVLV
jgi:hypothetical protein